MMQLNSVTNHVLPQLIQAAAVPMVRNLGPLALSKFPQTTPYQNFQVRAFANLTVPSCAVPSAAMSKNFATTAQLHLPSISQAHSIDLLTKEFAKLSTTCNQQQEGSQQKGKQNDFSPLLKYSLLAPAMLMAVKKATEREEREHVSLVEPASPTNIDIDDWIENFDDPVSQACVLHCAREGREILHRFFSICDRPDAIRFLLKKLDQLEKDGPLTADQTELYRLLSEQLKYEKWLRWENNVLGTVSPLSFWDQKRLIRYLEKNPEFFGDGELGTFDSEVKSLIDDDEWNVSKIIHFPRNTRIEKIRTLISREREKRRSEEQKRAMEAKRRQQEQALLAAQPPSEK